MQVISEDAKDAVKWMRENARTLDIDPHRVAVGGASAGGCMSALLGSIDRMGADSLSVPDLLLLEYPTLALPMKSVRDGMPPMLLCMGTKDEFTKREVAGQYVDEVRRKGNECEFHLFEGRHHPIFYYRKPLTDDYDRLLLLLSAFLCKHGYM